MVAEAWRAAVSAVGGRPVDADVDDLLARYRQPHRRYHTLDHVAAVLRDAGSLAADLEPAQRAHVALAACGHDVVYDGAPGADERASAEWTGAALRAAGVSDADAACVERLILLTADHATDLAADPADATAAVLLDADLAVLAADGPAYPRYVTAVRAEYHHLSEPDWRRGRAAVLRSLLDRDPLFLSTAGRTRWQEHARANLRAELAQLED